jgi:hypothetical protein
LIGVEETFGFNKATILLEDVQGELEGYGTEGAKAWKAWDGGTIGLEV